MSTGKPPDQMEVWQIMMQCDVDSNGQIRQDQVGRAVALYQRRHGQAGGGQDAASPPVDVGCQCIVS
ncbi:hypothetical protein HaLaN_00174 [Haematococcus lacustris]|uniref:EF-hand domain-containing protein n=1 Tax=Haematococcus lacustris TaxID=44745 RepID=A0A699Y8K1_HAELA|nr:hypothetical protein HaLaN_00174 [Haematococcus lacustris]